MQQFKLGNCLRGGFGGDFETIDEAWQILSERFLLSYPSSRGRDVLMLVHETNKYGFNAWAVCKEGTTSLTKTKEEHELVDIYHHGDREF